MKYEKPMMIDSKLYENDPEIQPMGLFIPIAAVIVVVAGILAGAGAAVGAAVGGLLLLVELPYMLSQV